MRKSNEEIIRQLQTFLLKENLEDKYKSKPSDFIRNRKLPFTTLILFMLRKLYKSLALEISEFFKEIQFTADLPTKSAFSQARQKLSPLFFQDLLYKFNEEFYTDNQQRVAQLQSMRILAVDGSTLDLPYSESLAQTFGTHSNQYSSVRYIKGRVSVVYDLLNHMILDGGLQPFAEGESVAALRHLDHCHQGDVLVYDRAYASFHMVYTHQQKGLHVVMRMKPSYSNQLQSFTQGDVDDTTIIMRPGKGQIRINPCAEDKTYSKDAKVHVRLVKFTLDDGQQALLLTTLLDAQRYPIAFLKQLYAMRWGVETRYDILKNVLQVEYFSGYNEQAILQDFYISLFLMNMQVLLAQDLQQEIQHKYGHRKYNYQINLAVAIGHLKRNVVELFTNKHPGEVLRELEKSFLSHVEPVRPGRKYPRHKDKYRTRKKPILMKNRKNVL